MKFTTQTCTCNTTKHESFCGYHKRDEPSLSFYQQIETLPDNCIDLIYKHVFDIKFGKVLDELKKDCEEYWDYVTDRMYMDEEYMEAHRLLPMPEPPLIDGVPNYECEDFCKAMDVYLNTVDDNVSIENWLTESFFVDYFCDAHIWLLGYRPSEYGY